METAEFLGYPRPTGAPGIRNHVLVVPSSRLVNIAAARIADHVPGTKAVVTTGENGRHSRDRERLARLFTGLGRNPNVHAVIVLGVKPGYGYRELDPDTLAAAVAGTGKPVDVLTVEAAGGLERTVEAGIDLARQRVREASRVRREPVPVGELSVGVKCGLSDATSGISGNPAFGRAADRLVGRGGTVIFSETVEIIGAEEELSRRCTDPRDAERLLRMAREAEAAARATGEDIRTINPLPSNIAAGLSTLEEKSLGAVEKAGSSPIAGVLEYATAPTRRGLHFMDGWQSSFSLPMSLAAAGCQLTVYQLGGEDLPSSDPPMLATNTGVVAPLMMITGNPRTAAKAARSVDFSSGGVITGGCTVQEAGDALFGYLAEVASGELTRGETVRWADVLEPYFLGPVF